MLAPATGFYVNPEQGRHQARITYCICIEDLKKAMKCLEEALKVYPGRIEREVPKKAVAKKPAAKKPAAKKK